MMQRPDPHRSQRAPLIQLGKEASRPIQIAPVRTRADEGESDSIVRHPGSEPPVLGRVLFRSKVAAASPRLVADAPEADVERVALAIRSAGLGRRGGAVG